MHRETFVVQRAARRMEALASDESASEVALGDWLTQGPGDGRKEARDVFRARIASLVVLASGATPSTPEAPEDDFLAAEERSHLTDALQRAVEGLAASERAFLHALYEEGLTLDAIATRMGVAKRTVQRLHERTKTRLAGELGELSRV